jgi:RNA 2',3'-cyclic 3'-phosphodiesterase
MRLFVAVVPPPEVLRELSAAVHQLTAAGGPGAAGAAGSDAGPRWTSDEGRHITLAFLGEVDEATLPDLTRRLARAAHRHPPLDLRLDGGGRFGDHVLWAGVAGDTAALGRLARSVTAAARRTGIPVDETRAFRPHLTLARGRGRLPLRPYAAALADFAGRPWHAARFALIRSHPPPPGVPGARSHYETLASWDLSGPPPTPP